MCDVAQSLIMKGKVEGRAEGKAEGIAAKTIQVYQNCIKRGMNQEDAIAISGISETQLKKLK
ncbi:MAG: hypothetical protein IJ167_03400 [Lachnospiraceae bacterium]|nr:hypothetical protein [Lachnospiraceae bacterium]